MAKAFIGALLIVFALSCVRPPALVDAGAPAVVVAVDAGAPALVDAAAPAIVDAGASAPVAVTAQAPDLVERCWLTPIPELGYAVNPCSLTLDLDGDGAPGTCQRT